NKGSVAALIIYHANPVYSLPNGKQFAEAIKKAGVSISIADRMDETASEVTYTCPDHHYLESWGDVEARLGAYSLIQPTISPLFSTRQGQDSLLAWSGSAINYEKYLQNFWQTNYYSKQTQFTTAADFWENSVRYGIFETPRSIANSYEYKGDLNAAVSAITAKKGNETELVLYEKVSLGNGKYANNPWLQELPDPITKATWDNYLLVPVKYAVDNKLSDGDYVEVTAGNGSVTVPILRQPGQQNNTFAIALGYGRTKSGPAGNNVGGNAYSLVSFDGTNFQYTGAEIKIKPTGKSDALAITQTHHTIEGRNIVKETTFDEWLKNPMAGNEEREEYKKINQTTLYPGHVYDKLKWNMSIDLNSCIGCGACSVACTAENNIPVVGKNEVVRVHEMHWMRIDRYYSFNNPASESLHDRITEEKKYGGEGFKKAVLEDYENVNVTFQPMLCQHCDNAPCENVCPVAATNHSSEGLNQMAYNRCIGTRYCANNCPYKVRRFNWFDYTTADSFPYNTAPETQRIGMIDDLTRMVLNPDVTVRSRGVMEKCSFCVQKIQDGKLQAKKEERVLRDGDIKTACQTACPSDAIVFGNVNDESSLVRKLKEDERTFYVLQDIHTLPSIGYMTKVRNIEEKKSNA
ncbi:MAG: 4Fe-4S dicluster domain-containing protein, partial [Pseudomonadota bacterium]